MQSKGRRGVNVLSAGGEIRLSRQYRWKKGVGGLCPADTALGIEVSDVSPGARELCSLMGIGADFDQARHDLKRVGGLSPSKERLRQITEGEGKNVRKVRDSGQLPAAWSADKAKLPDGRTRVYGGVDGVMTPTVTQVEKDKRRQKHITRRQMRGKTGVGNLKPLPPPKPGSDEKYKEKKIGLFYNQDKTLRHAFATEHTCEKFGPLLNSYAMQIGLEKADEVICLVDGAVWIYRQICAAVLCVQMILLDFYHLAEHVHATARCCIGQTDAGRTWASALLKQAKASDVAGMLASIEELTKKARSSVKKKSLTGLRRYITERKKMLGYATALQAGRDIGSGPTEAMCKTLTLRVKRPGMKWDSDNAAALMNLIAMRESGQWQTYWKEQERLAA
jgi:Uncharacterised protein family (UPF0236)